MAMTDRRELKTTQSTPCFQTKEIEMLVDLAMLYKNGLPVSAKNEELEEAICRVHIWLLREE